MFFSSSKNLVLVNERVLIIYRSDLFSVEFSSGISTCISDCPSGTFLNDRDFIDLRLK